MRPGSLIALAALGSLLQPSLVAAVGPPFKVALVGPRARAVAELLSRSDRLAVTQVDPGRPALATPGQWAVLAESLGARAVVLCFSEGRRRRTRLHLELRDSQGQLVGTRVLPGFPRAAVRHWVLTQLLALAGKSRPVEKPAIVTPSWIERPSRPAPPASRPASPPSQPVRPPTADRPSGEPDPFEEDPRTGQRLRAPAAAPAAEERRYLPFALSGDLWAHHLSYLQDRVAGTINSRNEVGLRLQIDGRLGSGSKYLRAHLNGVARFDASDEGRREAFFREAFVEAGWGPFSFCLGQRLLSWGATDAFNPTDSLRQPDLRDPLDVENRGLFLMQARLLLGQRLSLTAVFAPLFQPGIIPGPTGVNAQGQAVSTSRWFAMPELPVPPTFVPPPSPADGPDAFQYGGRLALTSSQLEAGLSYAYGTLAIPSFSFEPPSFLRGSYHRRHVFGLDFQWTVVAQLLAKGEAALSLTGDRDGSDPVVPDSYLTYLLQLEYTFSMIGGTSNNLRLAGQFYVEHDLRGKALALDLLHPFHYLGTLLLEWKLRDHTGVELTVLYNLPTGVVARLRAWHELVDGLRLEVTGLLLTDKDRSAFAGLFERNDRVEVKLRYSF